MRHTLLTLLAALALTACSAPEDKSWNETVTRLDAQRRELIGVWSFPEAPPLWAKETFGEAATLSFLTNVPLGKQPTNEAVGHALIATEASATVFALMLTAEPNGALNIDLDNGVTQRFTGTIVPGPERDQISLRRRSVTADDEPTPDLVLTAKEGLPGIGLLDFGRIGPKPSGLSK